jgi:hypothetical protein
MNREAHTECLYAEHRGIQKTPTEVNYTLLEINTEIGNQNIKYVERVD